MFLLRSLLAESRNSRVPVEVELSRQADLYAAQGCFDQAETVLSRLIQRAQKKDGQNAIEVGIYLRRLAYLKMQRHDYAGAIPLLHRLVYIQALNLGPYSADLLQTLDWLAQLYHGQKNFDAAIVMIRRVLDIRATIYGEKDVAAAPVFNGL